jgi:hypothetical protein
VKEVDLNQEAGTPTGRLAQLRQNLAEYFGDSELRDVCFDLGVSYDDLGGESKADKARELVAHLDRRGRLEELVALCSRLRPLVSWGNALARTDQAPAISDRAHERERPGDTISATISGNISGQVAVGQNITQAQIIGAAKPAVTEADLAELRQALADLLTQVKAQASPEQKQAAVERVQELGEAVTANEPDLSTMEYVKRWFVKNLPGLAGAVASIILHSTVGKLVKAAGDTLAADFRRRFGST